MLLTLAIAISLSSPLALPESRGRGAGGEGGPLRHAQLFEEKNFTRSREEEKVAKEILRAKGARSNSKWPLKPPLELEPLHVFASSREIFFLKPRRGGEAYPHPRSHSLPEGGRARGEVFAATASESKAIRRPRRIVSTNVCADQLALAIADRSRIVSVSRMAIEPQISNFADAARGIRVNHARAEEIVELKPDLILGDIYTGKGANRLAATLGVAVHIIGVGSSLDDVRAIIRDAATALGEPQRGAALIAEMDARIARARPAPGRAVTALVYEPNGVTSSSGTLSHDVLIAAGLRNLAPNLMSGIYGAVPLEAVVAAAPQLLILDDSYTGTSSRAQSILRHPAFQSLTGRTALHHMPSRLWLCPGPWVAEAVERLAAERARLAGALARPAKGE